MQMTSPVRLKQLYLVWIALTALRAIYSIVTGEYQEMNRAAVDMVPSESYSLSKSLMTIGFHVINAGFFLFQALTGWLFLVYALKKRIWAIILFIIFSLYMIYYYVDASISLPKMYPQFYSGIFDTITNWLSCIAVVAIFSFLIVGVLKLKCNSDSEHTT